MTIYRVRVTECYDYEASSKEEALTKFHSELAELLNGGNDLDTDVTEVIDSDKNHKDETESTVNAT